MTLSTKDKVALATAIAIGAIFGYLTIQAGFGALVVGGVYGILIVPLIIIFVADQRKFLVWQAGILSYVYCMESAGGGMPGVFILFWAIQSVISSPVPAYIYWRRSKSQGGHRLIWLLLGLVFVLLLCFSIFRDPFLFFGLSVLWVVACIARFAWEWRESVESHDPKVATLVASGVLLLAISTAVWITVFHKQETFREAMREHQLGIARILVDLGANPNLPDRWGSIALNTAAYYGVGHLEGVKALIAMGANVNQVEDATSNGHKSRSTPLRAAAGSGRTEICRTLLEAGASVDANGTQSSTPFLATLSGGSMNCAPLLLEYGANVNARDGKGKTALMFLMQYDPKTLRMQGILQKILAQGADTNATDLEGTSVKGWAAFHKHEDSYELLESLRNSVPSRK